MSNRHRDDRRGSITLAPSLPRTRCKASENPKWSAERIRQSFRPILCYLLWIGTHGSMPGILGGAQCPAYAAVAQCKERSRHGEMRVKVPLAAPEL